MPKADSKNYSEQGQQTVQNPYPQRLEEDTIDLYELWLTLQKRKWVIIVVTVVAAMGSMVYALSKPNIYMAEALLLPPKGKDVQFLNFIEINSEKPEDIKTNRISASSVFSKFIQNLNSRTLQKKFIQEKGLMKDLAPKRTAETRDEDIYNGFAELIKLEAKNDGASLSIKMHDARIAAQWVNDLTEFINKESIAMLIEDSQHSIENQIRDIEYKISSKRQMAKKRREDIIIQYMEAAYIAQKLGVMDRIDSTNIVQNNQLNITTSNIPLYFRGYRALNTEISFLKSRASDDPFISGLRDLQERLALLRTIKFDTKKIRTVRVDLEAYPSNSPIEPKRRLIVSIITVVGLFSGILLAFFIEFIKNHRTKYSE